MAEAGTAGEASPERLWWLRTLAVFQSPSATFTALRDDSERQADARQEPVLALTWLAGVAAVLTFGSTTATLLDFQVSDDFFRPTQLDTVEALVYIFLAGGLFALSSYWLGGGALHLGSRAAAGHASYRQARHVVAFALAPAVLSLLVWPFRLVLFGEDNFRSGGADSGASGAVFSLLQWAFFLWALSLLILGLRALNDWSIVRSLGAVVLAVMALGALALLFSLG